MMKVVMFSVVSIIYFFSSYWMMFEVGSLLFIAVSFWCFLDVYSSSIYCFSGNFSFDWLSCMLISLTLLITAFMTTASYGSVLFKSKSELNFIFLMTIMVGALLMSFLMAKSVMFYVFFEISLIPIFLMITGWGYQPERLQAGVYMLFYTLFGSLPLLLMILWSKSVFEYFFCLNQFFSFSLMSFIYMLFFSFAFLIKLPMFLTHLWLPKAHVEAPVAGSMILAGVLLKLGGYGLWRVSAFIGQLMFTYSILWCILGLVGGVIVSFICVSQIDMKSLVAYSSVVHMGIGLGGLCVLSWSGYEGMYCMMLGHGIVSSGLFFLVGVLYDRIHSRSLLISKGLMMIFPFFTMMWFMLSVFNISAPPCISLLGEIYLTMSLVEWSTFCTVWLMIMNFMGMVFTFFLYAQSQQGKPFKGLDILWSISVREQCVSVGHLVSLLGLTLIFWLF